MGWQATAALSTVEEKSGAKPGLGQDPAEVTNGIPVFPLVLAPFQALGWPGLDS